VTYLKSQILPADVVAGLQLEILSTLYLVDANGDLGEVPEWIRVDS